MFSKKNILSENLVYSISGPIYLKKSGWLSFEWFKAAKRLHEADLRKPFFMSLDISTVFLGPPPFGKKHLVSPIEFEQQLKHQSGRCFETDSLYFSEIHFINAFS
jgi:hypothetical protein